MRRKNVKFVAIRLFFQALNSEYTKTRFRPGICPEGPNHAVSLRRSPHPL